MTESRPLRVVLSAPRPSTRLGRIPLAERGAAVDLDALLATPSGATLAEVEVTLCAGPGGRWRPPVGMEGGWLHGTSFFVFLHRAMVQDAGGPWADVVARRLVDALSGRAWPDHAISSTHRRTRHVESVELDPHVGSVPPHAVLCGDVVRHAASGYLGAVARIDRVDRDGVAHLVVEPERRLLLGEASGALLDATGQARWTQAEISVLKRDDPYRRYHAMCLAEDDLARRLRRAATTGRDFLAVAAWERQYQRLTAREKDGPGGGLTYAMIGRDHWRRAAMDCLDRRGRAARSSRRAVLSISPAILQGRRPPCPMCGAELWAQTNGARGVRCSSSACDHWAVEGRPGAVGVP